MEDWLDIAWSHLMDRAPAMGDAQRYREIMYEALWLGKEPDYTADERKNMAENAKKRPRKAAAKKSAAPPLDQLAALNRQAEALRAKGTGVASPPSGG